MATRPDPGFQRPRSTWTLVPILASLFLVPATPVHAVEPWADRSLTVTGGLVLWLDASRQENARQALGMPLLAPGGPVDIWYDGSGLGRRIIQRLRPARPVFLTAKGKAVVRFDGQDDHLERRPR